LEGGGGDVKLSVLCVVALAFVPAFALAAGIVIHVPGDAATIQAAIDAAQAADTVFVACGTYYEHDIEMKDGVCLMSATGDSSCVTIDAEGVSRCINCYQVYDLSSITGFTFKNGRSDWGGAIYAEESSFPIRNCRFIDNNATVAGGGGVYWYNGVVDIADCSFEDNTADAGSTWPTGGAILLAEVAGNVARCTFSHNEAVSGAGMACVNLCGATIDSCTFFENTAYEPAGVGGGVYCVNGAAPAFWNCLFEDNTGGYAGGGLYAKTDCTPNCSGCTFVGNEAQWGGGVYLEDCISIWFVSCVFQENVATTGGGFYAWDVTSLTFTYVEFTQNAAVGGGGGLMCDVNSEVYTTGCTFDRNSANWGAAVATFNDSAVTMDYCTLAANDVTGLDDEGGAIYTYGTLSSADLNNCIIAFNTVGEPVVCDEGGGSVLYCTDVYGKDGGDWVGCIASQAGTDGNLNVDPKFCGLVSADYHLCGNSQCLPGHNDCLVRMGAYDAGCDDCDSAVKATSWGAIKALYR